MLPKIGLHPFLHTIRGKLTALVITAVVIAVVMAAYAALLTPRLAVEAARPLVQSGGAALTTSFRESLLSRERTVLHSQVKPGLQQELPLADAGQPGALAFLRLANAEVTATPGIRAVALLSAAGDLLALSGQPLSPSDLLLARRALSEQRVLYGTPYLIRRTALAAMAVPIFRGGHGPLIGVEAAVFDLTALAEGVEARSTSGVPTWQAFGLVTPQGILLYDHYRTGLGKPIVNRAVLTALLDHHGPGSIYVGQFYAPNARRPVLGNFDSLPGIGYHLYLLTGEGVPAVNTTLPLLLALIALAVGALALRLGGYRLTQPIQEAVAAARAFGGGDLSARIPAQRDAEFQDLAAAFNEAAAARAESLRVESLLARAQEELARAESEEALLRSVAESAERILQARLSLVFTPDPDGWLLPRSVSGEAAAYPVGIRISIRPDRPEGRGPGGVAFREGRCIAMATTPPYPPGLDFAPWAARAVAHRLRYIMVLPLIYQGATLGLLNCYLGQAVAPPAVAQEAVQALALTAAAALHGLSLREETMLSLAGALEARDDETEVHALRVSLYAERLAEELGIHDPEQLQRIRWGALLHDVGKIGLPDTVLRKPGPLTPEEWGLVHLHPKIGYELIRRLAFLGDAREIVRCHHEHFDGSGYPRHLKGEEIPLGARIFAVVDAFDAITSDRPYRPARSCREAQVEIRRVAGSQLDPAVVAAFSNIPRPDWEDLRRRAEAGFYSRFRTGRATG